jgi:hypothetical protein
VAGGGLGVGVVVVAVGEIRAVLEEEIEAAIFEIGAVAVEVVAAELIDDEDDGEFGVVVVSAGGRGGGDVFGVGGSMVRCRCVWVGLRVGVGSGESEGRGEQECQEKCREAWGSHWSQRIGYTKAAGSWEPIAGSCAVAEKRLTGKAVS